MNNIKKMDILPFQIMKIVGKTKIDVAKNFAISTRAILGDDNGFVLVDNTCSHI